jgi:hypothetical protein
MGLASHAMLGGVLRHALFCVVGAATIVGYAGRPGHERRGVPPGAGCARERVIAPRTGSPDEPVPQG